MAAGKRSSLCPRAGRGAPTSGVRAHAASWAQFGASGVPPPATALPSTSLWNGVDDAAIGLFDLASDSLEQTNLLGTVGQASRVKNMLARFVARRNSERTAP